MESVTIKRKDGGNMKEITTGSLIDDTWNGSYIVTEVNDDSIRYALASVDDDNEKVLKVYGFEEIMSTDDFQENDNWKVVERNAREKYTIEYGI